jgi:RNA polymerase sigma-70 factor (ECF subfamily)
MTRLALEPDEVAADDSGPGASPAETDGGMGLGEPQTLDTFLATAEHKAYLMARYALWDHELALDIVQDSMLKLVERYAQKPAAEWPLLFFTIVNNRINDARRRRRVRRFVSLFAGSAQGDEEASEMEMPIADDLPGERDDPVRAIAARRLGVAIEGAVGRLPERQRQVFLLREWQELSVKETAQVLGCTEGTVKQHHFRALQGLRALLAEVRDHE